MTSTTSHTDPAAETESPNTEMLELDRPECLRLLGDNVFGRIAAVTPDGTPVIRPVNYVFDDRSQSVVLRTALGSKFHALLKAGKAAFEIDGIDRATQTGWSVIVSGNTEEVVGQSEIERLNKLGLRPWAAGARHHYVRLRAYTVSGRRIVFESEHLPGYRV